MARRYGVHICCIYRTPIYNNIKRSRYTSALHHYTINFALSWSKTIKDSAMSS
jgi:hypothetical protein